jgi:dTDP-4-amino-4,6-dideoxygalactose transaminase
MPIHFNKPYFSGKELHYIQEALQNGKISGDGAFTHQCHQFFENRYGFQKCLLTTSCTDALEMCAILLDIQPDDEIIMPSFTFVSCANAFVLRGAQIIFADSSPLHPNMDVECLEALISPKTKAILVMHYGGVACEMDKVKQLADKYQIYLIEDAAHALDASFKGKPLGSFGHLATFSFHETKNIMAGEGGLLVINEAKWAKRAEIIREKGTNRAAFFRGEVDKYVWVDVGSSFLPSDMIAAFLYAQLENLDDIQAQRQRIWQRYYQNLLPLAEKGFFQLPYIPAYAQGNAHLFYILCQDSEERADLIAFLARNQIQAIFHYVPLHQSPFFLQSNPSQMLPHAERYAQTLLRLPFYYELEAQQIDEVCACITEFYLR